MGLLLSKTELKSLMMLYGVSMALLWKLPRSVDHAIEAVLLTGSDDASGFLRTVQRTGIAI